MEGEGNERCYSCWKERMRGFVLFLSNSYDYFRVKVVGIFCGSFFPLISNHVVRFEPLDLSTN